MCALEVLPVMDEEKERMKALLNNQIVENVGLHGNIDELTTEFLMKPQRQGFFKIRIAGETFIDRGRMSALLAIFSILLFLFIFSSEISNLIELIGLILFAGGIMFIGSMGLMTKHNQERAQNSLKRDPSNLELCLMISAIFIKRKENQKALTILERTLPLYSNNDILWNLKGRALLGLKKITDAISCFEKGHSIRQTSDSYYGLACAYALNDNFTLCLDYLNQAVLLDSECKTLALKEVYFKKLKKNPDFLSIVKS